MNMNTDDVSLIASLLRPSFDHLGIELVDVQWSGSDGIRSHAPIMPALPSGTRAQSALK